MAISVKTYFKASSFFEAVEKEGKHFVPHTAICNRLLCTYVNLEFTFGGEKKLIGTGGELLAEIVKAGVAGIWTKEDAAFAVAQLCRINLVFDSMRTIFSVQYDDSVVDTKVEEKAAPVLTEDKEEAKIEVVAEKPKAGRKPANKA